MSLSVQALHIEKNHRRLLSVDQLDIISGAHTVILGSNGAGKTTLLNALAGGNVAVKHDNIALNSYSHAQLATRRAFLSQQQNIAFPLSVQDLTALGREPYRGTADQAHDSTIIDYTLNQFDLNHLRSRNSQTLSGGEQHRAHLARTLAQILPNLEADLHGKWLLLDEPTNHLDLAHIHHLMHIIHSLTNRGLTIISVLHDPGLAINHANHLILIQDDTIRHILTPEELASNPQHLSALYGVNIDIHQHCNHHHLTITN